ESFRGGEFIYDCVLSPLVVCRRAEFSCFGFVVSNTAYVSIERQVEVEPRLFPIRNHVQACADLVVYGRCHGILDHFFDVGAAKAVEVLASELEPSWKGITSDHRCAEGNVLRHVGFTWFGLS